MKNILAAVLVFLSFSAWASEYEDGMSAYKKKDFSTAVKKFKSATNKGHAEAQYNLALMYDTGEGVAQNYSEAVRLYKLAAEQGLASAQFNLGLMYKDGIGVTQNHIESIKWFKLSAARGYGQAQTNLGYMYRMGQGVPQDYVKAHMWSNLAAAQGNLTAIENRDLYAKQMTPLQVAEAQKLARDCQAKNFKKCD